jgi:hypothetical protein
MKRETTSIESPKNFLFKLATSTPPLKYTRDSHIAPERSNALLHRLPFDGYNTLERKQLTFLFLPRSCFSLLARALNFHFSASFFCGSMSEDKLKMCSTRVMNFDFVSIKSAAIIGGIN